MKKVFVSYKFTGEALSELEKNMGMIIAALREKGYQVFCNIESEAKYRKDKFTSQQIMADALENLEKSEVVFVFNNSDSRSEGMLIEIGYAVAKQIPIILAARKGISVNSSKSVSSKVIEFESMDDLLIQIKTLDI